MSVLPGQAALTWQAGLQEGERRLSRQELESAEACFRQALRDVKRDKAASLADLALCQEKLAMILYKQDEREESVKLYRQSISTLEKARRQDKDAKAINGAIIKCDLALGNILEFDGEFKSARSFYEKAEALAASDNEKIDQERLALCRQRLASLLVKLGERVKAEELYFSALELLLGSAKLSSATLAETIVADYQDLLEKEEGRKNLASHVQAELLKDRIGSLPKKAGIASSNFDKEVRSRFVAPVEGGLGDLALRGLTPTANSVSPVAGSGSGVAGGGIVVGALASSSTSGDRLDSSLKARPTLALINKQRRDFYERMIAIDIKSLGADHPSVARDLYGLAVIEISDGNIEAARQLLQRTLKIYEKVYGADASLTQRSANLLEVINAGGVDSGNTSSNDSNGSSLEAAPSFVDKVPILPLVLQKLDFAVRLNYLAALAYSLGRLERANQFYLWALADTYLTTGDRNMLLAATLKDFARLLKQAPVSGNALTSESLESDAHLVAQKARRSNLIEKEAGVLR
ncbi:MAG: tetratricopeptide repeat protein [Candidatus Obscuribacterales bacterium]|nr:tetratricopeptide repeat protein [Candidatus Obscuribacterales bacterium]